MDVDQSMAATRSILIVDDDESICEFVSVALREEGYRVLTAGDGRAALDLVRDDPPALILLDLWMPEMDGTAFLEAYRRTQQARAPIVIFAASPDATSDAALAGVSGYLPKPVELADLLDIVGRFAGRGLSS